MRPVEPQKEPKSSSTPASECTDRFFSLPALFYLLSGLALILFYFFIMRNLNFFVPRDFTYAGGAHALVPFGKDLSQSYIRNFAPWFLASMFWKILLLFPAAFLLTIFLIKKIKPGAVDVILGRVGSISPGIFLGVFCILALSAIMILIVCVFQNTYVTDDENAYVMQARILLGGHIIAPAPPVAKSFDNWFIITKGIFTGKYTLGFPALLALGKLLTGSFHSLPVLLAILTILLFYFIGRGLYERRTGILAAFMLTVSPFFLFNSATLLSHASTLFFLSLFMLTYFAGLRKRSWILGVIAGLAIGIAFNIRQLTAIGFGLPFAIYVLWRLRKERGRDAGFVVALAGAFALCVAFTLWYNKLISGKPFMFPFNVCDPNERIGFGAMLNNLRYTHTPLKGIENLVVSIARLNLWLLGMPCSLLFALLAIIGGRFRTGDCWCLTIIASFFIAYIFYYSPGVPDTGPIYYFELLLPILLLSARGLITLHGLLKRWGGGGRMRAFPAVFLCISLLLSFATFYPEKALHIITMTDKIKEPYDLVESRVEKPALVFIRSQPQVGWVFSYRNTDPYLKGELIFCRELGAQKDRDVIKHFPGRNYYILSFDPEKGRSEIRSFTRGDLDKFLRSSHR